MTDPVVHVTERPVQVFVEIKDCDGMLTPAHFSTRRKRFDIVEVEGPIFPTEAHAKDFLSKHAEARRRYWILPYKGVS